VGNFKQPIICLPACISNINCYLMMSFQLRLCIFYSSYVCQSSLPDKLHPGCPCKPNPLCTLCGLAKKVQHSSPCAGGSSTAQIPAELIAHCCSSPPAAQRNLPSSAPSLEALCFVGVQAEPQLCGLAVAVPQQVVWGFSPEPILHHPVPTGPPA